MPRLRLLVLLVLAISVLILWGRGEPDEVRGSAHVIDGDSLKIRGTAIRLKGIDAPELDQACEDRHGRSYPCGEVSRRGLARLVARQEVACRREGRDRYRRMLARCTVRGEDLGAAMVAQGLAVGYRAHAAEERAARAAGRGLWAGRFEQPSNWRARNGGSR